jgi:P27 family predicted phage terminase small subunit
MAASDAPDPAAPLAEAPAPPAHLSARAAAEWRRLAPAAAALGTLAGADLRGFELLAETLATEAAARAVVEAEGHAVPTSGGGRKPRPEVRVMETARAQAARLLAEFGLTPKGRRELGVLPAGGASSGDPDDPLRALLDDLPPFGPRSRRRG